MQLTLEDFLRAHVARLMSPDADPLPPCPRCAGVRISKKGYLRRDTGRLPACQCNRRGLYFNRLSGETAATDTVPVASAAAYPARWPSSKPIRPLRAGSL